LKRGSVPATMRANFRDLIRRDQEAQERLRAVRAHLGEGAGDIEAGRFETLGSEGEAAPLPRPATDMTRLPSLAISDQWSAEIEGAVFNGSDTGPADRNLVWASLRFRY
jgi:hypothetical protein